MSNNRIVDRAAPLLVMVHGKAGNDQVMRIFIKNFPDSFNVFYPQAPLVDPLGGFSWWLNNTESDYQAGALSLDTQIEEFIEINNLAPKQLIACGFSQGGGCLSWLIQQEKYNFTHLALLASFILVDERAADLVWPEVFIAHGYDDDKISLSFAMEGISYLQSKRTKLTILLDSVGHKMSSRATKYLANWAEKI